MTFDKHALQAIYSLSNNHHQWSEFVRCLKDNLQTDLVRLSTTSSVDDMRRLQGHINALNEIIGTCENINEKMIQQ